MAAKKSLKDRFEALAPDRKRNVVIGLVLGGFITLISAAVVISESGDVPRAVGQNAADQDVRNVLMTTPGRELGLQGVANDVDTLELRLNAIEKENERLKVQLDAAAAKAASSGLEEGGARDPDAALAELAGNVDERRNALRSPIGTIGNTDRPGVDDPLIDTTNGVVRPTRNNQIRGGSVNNGQAEPVEPAAAPQIQTFRETVRKPARSAADRARAALPPVYIPTGSIFTGTMLNGLDAPTGRSASNQPIPVLVRVKHEAILPSRFSSDVREAFMLAAGFGDLSSERAYLRAERFSMILKDGRVIDIPVKAAAVGDDGKTGVRGRIVSKQGAVIGKALLAGMADGISRAFGGTQLSSGGGSSDENTDIGAAAFGGGASTGLDRVASYFLSQAEAMYPVVEIDGGREVSFILLEGVELAHRAAAALEAAEAEEDAESESPDTASS